LIESNIARAHKLIQDFKKLWVGQLSDTIEPLDLVTVIDEVISLFKISARQAKLSIEVRNSLSEPTERAWLGYRGYLTQVVLNLLSNIERYAYPDGEGGRVKIDTASEHQRKGESFVLTVRDFGRGIAADDLPKIFVPFHDRQHGRHRVGDGNRPQYRHHGPEAVDRASVRARIGHDGNTTVSAEVIRLIPR
jgi:signal transduction histidine kinase